MPDIQNIPTTQYIGPRIIPHLWDPITWSASEQYDALAVVQYNGVPYIARYVPPQGTLPTDTEYWVRWADFNAQMAQLQQTVESFDNRITANATDIDTLEAIVPRSAFSSTNTVQKAINDEVTARQQAITSEASARSAADTALGNRITSEVTAEASARSAADTDLQEQIDSIEQNVNPLDYAVFIGDSYLRGTGSTDGPTGGEGFNSIGNGWGKTLATLEGLSASKVMCIAGGGGGFVSAGVNGGGNGLNFTGMINRAAELMTADQINRIRYVVILGGVNDGMDITESSINNALSAARSAFPHKPIHVFTNLGTSATLNRHGLTNGNAYAYQKIASMCARGGASFHDTWKLGYGSSIFADDNIHLTSTGYTYLARAMRGAIHGGIITPNLDYNGYFDVSPANGVTMGAIPPYFDGVDTVDMTGLTFTIDTSVLNLNGMSQLGSIPAELAPRFNIYSLATLQATVLDVTNILQIPFEVTNSGIIRVRRALAANTTVSNVNGIVYAHYPFTSDTVIIYSPVLHWNLR